MWPCGRFVIEGYARVAAQIIPTEQLAVVEVRQTRSEH